MFLNSLDWENKIQQANTIASENSNLPQSGGISGIVKSLVGNGNSNLSQMGIGPIGGAIGGSAPSSLFSRVMNTASPAIGQAFGGDASRKGSSGLGGFGGFGGAMGGGPRVMSAVLRSMGMPLPGEPGSPTGPARPMSIMGALAQTGAIPDLPPIQGAATGGQPIPIPVIPVDQQQGLAPTVDFTDINRQAQQSTKETYPWWWKEHGPKGTGWFGPGDPEDLTN